MAPPCLRCRCAAACRTLVRSPRRAVLASKVPGRGCVCPVPNRAPRVCRPQWRPGDHCDRAGRRSGDMGGWAHGRQLQLGAWATIAVGRMGDNCSWATWATIAVGPWATDCSWAHGRQLQLSSHGRQLSLSEWTGLGHNCYPECILCIQQPPYRQVDLSDGTAVPPVYQQSPPAPGCSSPTPGPFHSQFGVDRTSSDFSGWQT